MSLSKLESLPNEILTDIIENYMNGVDVLMAFSYQLNRRFDALIAQCYRLHFNFIQCRKDDLRFCIGLLPAYSDKVEELALSEQDAPGQIHSFLFFFPSFAPFKRLRRLSFDYNGEAVAWEMVQRALLSLFDTTIDTLSIKIMNAVDERILNRVIARLLNLKTLKRLSIVSNLNYIHWNYFSSISSNIEYLSIPGIHFELQNLQFISQWAPRLKYFNSRASDGTIYLSTVQKLRSKENMIPMSALRFLVLSFEDVDSTTLDTLAPYLKAMPLLNRLEIKASSKLVDADAWEMLLKTSLPLLTHFTLRTTTFRLRYVDIYNVRASFQSSFWLSKENFNIIITDHKDLDFNTFDRFFTRNLDQYDFNLPVIQCSIAPDRPVNDSFNTVNKITSLRLSVTSNIVLCHYYFDNVKCLIVDNMNRSLFKWMTTNVNCSRITEVTITLSYKEIDELASLLACVPNMSSLHISFDLLIDNKDAFVGKIHCLKRLDIFISKHVFNEEDIIVIAKLFPYLEHIKINTLYLYNVPLLKTYLPHLRSLTYGISINYLISDKWAHELREKTKFLFQFNRDSISVWIDQAVYEEPYWQTFAVEASQSIARSITTQASSSSATTAKPGITKKKKHRFSFLKFFKR